MAMDRIGMRYKGESPDAPPCRQGTLEYCSQNAPLARAALAEVRGAESRALALRHADPPLDLAAVRPPDVRQGIPQHALRACIDRDFHFASVESSRRAVGFLRNEPDVYPLRRRLVDLARLAECLLQSAHGFSDIVRGNARHRTDGIAGVPAAAQRQESKGCHHHRGTQHNTILIAAFEDRSVAGYAKYCRRLKSQNEDTRAAYVNAGRASCRAASLPGDARR